MKEKLIVTRNFLYRLFLIGFVINIIVQIILMVAVKGQGIMEASSIIMVPAEYLMQLIVTSIVIMRVILFYFVLLPALALHWTIARDKNLS